MPAQIKQSYLQNEQTNTGILGERQRQQAEFSDNATRTFSGFLSGNDNPSDEHIRRAAALTANRLGQQNKLFPEVIPEIRRILIESKDRAGTIAQLRNSVMAPSDVGAQAPVGYGASGQTVYGTRAQQEQRATGGGYQMAAPMSAPASAAELAADRVRMGNYQQEITPWQNAYKALKELGPGGTAPGAEGRVDFQAFLYGLAPSLVPDSAKKNIKNFEELRKYLAQATQTQAAGLSPHTNEGLTTTVTGNPNTKITDMTNEQLIRYRIGMRKYEHAQMVAAEKEGGDIGYSAAKARLANTLDPNAFGIESASPEELKRIGSLKGKERDNFNRSLRAAYEAGVVTRPGQ